MTSPAIPIARSPIRSAASRASVGVEVDDRDRGAAHVHLARGLEADPAGGAGDQRHLSVEVVCGIGRSRPSARPARLLASARRRRALGLADRRRDPRVALAAAVEQRVEQAAQGGEVAPPPRREDPRRPLFDPLTTAAPASSGVIRLSRKSGASSSSMPCAGPGEGLLDHAWCRPSRSRRRWRWRRAASARPAARGPAPRPPPWRPRRGCSASPLAKA